jgi:UDP-2,3-diacylglucosamine pyrophosphatase LpxH
VGALDAWIIEEIQEKDCPDHVYVLSDVHIGAGPLQDFRFDSELIDFLDQRRGSKPLVVFNGDALDFPQTLPEIESLEGDPRIGSSEQQSAERLREIINEHQDLFACMRRFVEDGGRIIFQPGNHDVDLVWPEVKRLLEQVLDPDATGRGQCKGSLPLILWGKVWVEHGNQWSLDGNHYFRWDAPFLKGLDGLPRLEQCWGTWFVRSFINQVDQQFPFIDNVWPFNNVVYLIMRQAPLKLLIHIYSLYRRIDGTIAEPFERPSPFGTEEIGTSAERQFWQKYYEINNAYRQEEEEVVRLFVPKGWTPPGAGFKGWVRDMAIHQFLEQVEARLAKNPNPLAHYLYGQFILGWRVAMAQDLHEDQLDGAQKIHQACPQICHVLMGHSHVATQNNLFQNQHEAPTGLYTNTGTWVPFWEIDPYKSGPNFDQLKSARSLPYQLTYAHLVREPNNEVSCALKTHSRGNADLRSKRKTNRPKTDGGFPWLKSRRSAASSQ